MTVDSKTHETRAAELLGWRPEDSEVDVYESLDAIPGCVRDAVELLGSRLLDNELGTHESLDAIPSAVADIVVRLARRDVAAACAYLTERVPAASAVEETVTALMENRSRRFLSFSDEERIRSSLGRDIEPHELEIFDSLETVSEAVEIVVAKTSFHGHSILAVRYLHERVPTQPRSDAMVRTEEIEKTYPHLR